MSACFRLVYQNIAGVGLAGVVAHLRDKAGLRDIEVAAAFVHFFACLVRCKRRPFRADVKLAGIFSSASSTSGRVSVMASFIVSTRTK